MKSVLTYTYGTGLHTEARDSTQRHQRRNDGRGKGRPEVWIGRERGRARAVR